MSRVKVLLAKMGLDSHDTGVVTVAQMLRDAGMEVIYLGLHRTAREVVDAAVDEDVQVIGLSFLSGQHLVQTRKVLAELRRRNVDIPLVVGGMIPPPDIAPLKELGVAEVFRPGLLSEAVVSRLLAVVKTPA